MDHRIGEVYLLEEGIDIWRALESEWREIAREAAAERGVFTVALSGGRTPLGLYCHLSRAQKIPWEMTEIFQVDERFVPADSGDSNALMIHASLLENVSLPAERVHFVDVGEATAAAAAAGYERELRNFFNTPSGDVPRFDLVLLGIGKDGHTASLFPGAEILHEEVKWVAAVRPGSAPHERVTLTLPVLNAARNVFFLATGAEKAEAIAKVREKMDKDFPASMVRPKAGKLAFYLDRAAGSGI